MERTLTDKKANPDDSPIPKCLIVDDLEENIISLSALLSTEKVKVITARSGLEALDLLLKHDFALALLDVQMPGMDGFELAEIMRSTEKTRVIPIIFVTAATTDVQRVFQGYEAGAVDFLQKPLAPKIVSSKVRIFLELYNQKLLLEQKLEKIRETEAYLQKALKSRDEFLSIASHELKTPLTSLKMQIQITNRLKEKKGDDVAYSKENMERFLAHTDRSVERIIHLVNDMLDISRVATGRLSLNTTEIDLGIIVKEVSERLLPFMELANCELNVIAEDNLVGNYDKFRIEQVLTNLLTNAAKYAPDKPVTIRAYRDGNHAIVDVTDEGEGISTSDQGRIFDRFERAVSSTSVSGMGLGLYISKEIIDMHHGALGVRSIMGEGSTFTIKLPLL
jgi:signal transduction histidine kinase